MGLFDFVSRSVKAIGSGIRNAAKRCADTVGDFALTLAWKTAEAIDSAKKKLGQIFSSAPPLPDKPSPTEIKESYDRVLEPARAEFGEKLMEVETSLKQQVAKIIRDLKRKYEEIMPGIDLVQAQDDFDNAISGIESMRKCIFSRLSLDDAEIGKILRLAGKRRADELSGWMDRQKQQFSDYNKKSAEQAIRDGIAVLNRAVEENFRYRKAVADKRKKDLKEILDAKNNNQSELWKLEAKALATKASCEYAMEFDRN